MAEGRAWVMAGEGHARATTGGPARPMAGERAWVAVAAWGAMLAASCAQYGYAALAARAASPAGAASGPVAGSAAGWSPQVIAWGFAAWACCQAGAGAALPWLRRRLALTPPKTVTAGAVACAGGLLALGWAPDPAAAIGIYAVAAGVGAGLVCGTCVAVTTAWYPGRPARVAAVTGAFGYGAVPVIALVAGARERETAFAVLAWAILLITATCAPLLREPPDGRGPGAAGFRRRAAGNALGPIYPAKEDP